MFCDLCWRWSLKSLVTWSLSSIISAQHDYKITGTASTLGIHWMLKHSVVCVIVSKDGVPLKEHQIVLNRRKSWRASTNKSTLAAPGVNGTTPLVSAPPHPQIAKHQSIPQRLESLLISAAGSGSLQIRWVEQGRSSQGGRKRWMIAGGRWMEPWREGRHW